MLVVGQQAVAAREGRDTVDGAQGRGREHPQPLAAGGAPERRALVAARRDDAAAGQHGEACEAVAAREPVQSLARKARGVLRGGGVGLEALGPSTLGAREESETSPAGPNMQRVASSGEQAMPTCFEIPRSSLQNHASSTNSPCGRRTRPPLSTNSNDPIHAPLRGQAGRVALSTRVASAREMARARAWAGGMCKAIARCPRQSARAR